MFLFSSLLFLFYLRVRTWLFVGLTWALGVYLYTWSIGIGIGIGIGDFGHSVQWGFMFALYLLGSIA